MTDANKVMAGGLQCRTDYHAKWLRQASLAMVKAMQAGEDIYQAAERIHRRYHRAVSVGELIHAGSYVKLRIADREPRAFAWAPQWNGDGYGVGNG